MRPAWRGTTRSIRESNLLRTALIIPMRSLRPGGGRSASGMTQIRCHRGTTGDRNGIDGRAWSRSWGSQRFAALNDFGFSHQGDMTGNCRHVGFGSLQLIKQAVESLLPSLRSENCAPAQTVADRPKSNRSWGFSCTPRQITLLALCQNRSPMIPAGDTRMYYFAPPRLIVLIGRRQ